MPSGSLPSYAYRPPPRPNEPVKLKSCSSRRSRLWAGGTYFRVREPGMPGNKISAEVTEDGYCIITNSVIKIDENVEGTSNTKILELNGKYTDLWIIENTGPTPLIKYYSISCQIALERQNGVLNNLPPPSWTQNFKFGDLFSDGNKLIIRILPDDVATAISISPRFRIYKVETITKPMLEVGQPPPTDGVPIGTGLDIENLRGQINANDPWVEMKPRSGPIWYVPERKKYPNPNPSDVLDTGNEFNSGNDKPFLEPFQGTFFEGGNGLPSNPDPERTGPSRALIHVNYGELDDGTLGEHNVVYEWAGETATQGIWKPY